jgi:hypothetical protein
MVKVKRMNESLFAKLHKELTIAGELIRARQEEKQGLLDEFDEEARRYFFGKISQRALASSVKKTNVELKRLDISTREAISRVRNVAARSVTLAGEQAPVAFRATMTGIIGGKVKKTKVTKKKKGSKRRVTKRKASRKKR